ncbi:hypothetical protein [Asticcacaulis sp. YBE204]|uniref:hypothetical protein n=1 Tax=Asticcacaulis sp. YBE204 TaxID=1282363 RepID=UPI0003C3EA9C|nr:hypothetical protein [Asticcacaulis sp. YBE204]ESQ76939.1 hypothetical protein AEYBE204_18865 [Asticcacaulis sp. YBE204]
MSKIVTSVAAAAVVLGLSFGAANAATAPKPAEKPAAVQAVKKAETHKHHAKKAATPTKAPTS